ncbi:MAG: hypothetical protein ACYDH1_02955 [Anaerolineaceae bacterium]
MATPIDLEKKIKFLDSKISQGERLLKILLYVSIADVILIIAGILMAIFLQETQIFIFIGIVLAIFGLVIMFFLLRHLNDLKKGLTEYMQRRNDLRTRM